MKIDEESQKLLEQIHQLQQRIITKLEDGGEAGVRPNLAEALEELKVCVEELRVVGEELKRQNDALAAQRQRYADLFNFAPDSYLVTDVSANITEANRAAIKIFNCPQHVLMGKPLFVFVAAEERSAFLNRLSYMRMENAEKVDEWRITIRPRVGADILTAATVGAIRDPASRLTGLRWVFRVVPEH